MAIMSFIQRIKGIPGLDSGDYRVKVEGQSFEELSSVFFLARESFMSKVMGDGSEFAYLMDAFKAFVLEHDEDICKGVAEVAEQQERERFKTTDEVKFRLVSPDTGEKVVFTFTGITCLRQVLTLMSAILSSDEQFTKVMDMLDKWSDEERKDREADLAEEGYVEGDLNWD